MAFVPAGAMASASGDFSKGWNAFHALKKNARKAKQRQQWLSVGQRFTAAYVADTDGPYAPKALYYLGRVYEELGLRSGRSQDFITASDYFQRQATSFPKHDWTDDALYRKAVLNLERLNEPDLAYVDLLLIVHQHPKGDMRPRAEKLLKQLDTANARQLAVSTPRSSPGPPAPPRKVDPQPAATSSGGKVALREIRHFSSKDYTRVVLELTGPAKYSTNIYGHNAALGKPERLAIDLSGAVLGHVEKQTRIDDGLLTAVRSGQFTPETARVVLDFNASHRHEIFSLPDPYRVVVDVFATDDQPAAPGTSAASASEAKKRLHSPTKSNSSDLVKQLGLTIKTIMIDPGHGGKDPGAVRGGVFEKDIVLQVAKKVGARLRKQGYDVHYTRETDVFIPLERRTAMANGQKADLFVSIHINASRNTRLQGLETYSLNLTKNRNAQLLAARENATNTKSISDLQLILSQFMMNSKIKESKELADAVQDKTVRAVKKSYPITDHGIREAPFYVLMGARMPAVLVELGYMSNQTEFRRLRNSHYQNHLADGIVAGIEAYKKKIESYASL